MEQPVVARVDPKEKMRFWNRLEADTCPVLIMVDLGTRNYQADKGPFYLRSARAHVTTEHDARGSCWASFTLQLRDCQHNHGPFRRPRSSLCGVRRVDVDHCCHQHEDAPCHPSIPRHCAAGL